jgi:hypothetical protein
MVITKYVMFCVMSKLNCDFDIMVVLQNCMDMLKSELYSSTEKRIMSSDEVNLVVGIKVEEVSVVKMEEDRETTSPPVIKTELPVSCMSVCIQCYTSELPVCWCVCLSV